MKSFSGELSTGLILLLYAASSGDDAMKTLSMVNYNQATIDKPACLIIILLLFGFASESVFVKLN